MDRLLLVFISGLLLLTACKGCGDPCNDVSCPAGEACIEGTCTPLTPNCVPECDADQVCEDRVCVTPQSQCAAAGDTCDATRPAGTTDFLCLDLDAFGPRPGECVEFCAPDGSCPSGSLCFFVTSASDPQCESNDDCEAGRECSGGVCLQTICRPSECDGFVAGAEACSELYANTPGFEGGAQCYDVGNDARYCYPAGDQSEGAECGSAIDAIIDNSFAATCQSGLACVDDVCRVACLDDTPCTGGEECILEDEDFVDTDTGICGASCTPFEVGSCGEGQTCIPVSGDEGVCTPAGGQPAFAECTPGAGECADGTLCVTFQNDPAQIARCQPVCNLTVAEANEDGSVGEFAQTQRDATCPQPDTVVQSYLLFTNLAEIGSGIDVYVGNDAAPTVAALALDARSDGDAAAGTQFLSVAPGSTTIRMLPEGAPSTDAPLVELTLNLVNDGATEVFVLPVSGALDEVELLPQPAVRGEAAPAAGSAKIRPLAGLADEPAIDVVLVPPMDDLSDPTNQVELAGALTQGALGPYQEVTAGSWDLLVFAAGDPRTTRMSALVDTTLIFVDQQIATLAVRGTVDPDDSVNAGALLVDFVEPPAVGEGGALFTCVDPQSGGPFGYCQQNCGGTSAGFGTVCEGEQMGCHPTFLPANNGWANLCAPLGAKALGDPCNPFVEFGECGEGLYCLEYGNTVADYDALLRGRCTSLCVEGATDDPILSCAADQACGTISFDPDFRVGQCGYPCAPDASYGDAACPVGLESCKPTAALIEDPGNPDALPTTMVTQSFCSAAGDIASGATCTANDCVAGSECMFARSEQQTFTSTLLAQYFGGAGLTPSCQPQCDPFDGDSAPASCAAGETCLFNFPYSAEVGHCTEIDVELEPLQACSNPGRACGEDSICVINGGQPTCLQFCQYTGPDATGELQSETCTAGFLCAPLVNDIGVCLSPG